MQKTPSTNMMADINITPLVDVMLVLLVIFMLVTPAISQTMSQPIQPSPPGKGQDTHKLVVQAGDTFLLDGKMISSLELKQHFSESIRSDGKYAVQVYGEPDASYQSITEAMSIAKNVGVENLSLASN